MAAVAAAESVEGEVLPPSLDSTAEPPLLFDGTTRMYISYICPYAQRTWIARNYKGLQKKIKLVPIDLQNRPSWYKEQVYPTNKVPSLEHNNEVKGESLDLLKYIDTHFEGPVLLPNDPAKRQFAEEFLSYSDAFNHISLKAFTSNDDFEKEVGPSYDRIEDSLSKFDDGPFFLGQFSLVDAAYAPFIERFQPLFAEVRNYDITKGRPKLALWIQELNKIEAYRQTQLDPSIILGALKYKLGVNFIPSAESQTLTEVAFQVFLFQLSLADGCCACKLLVCRQRHGRGMVSQVFHMDLSFMGTEPCSFSCRL